MEGYAGVGEAKEGTGKLGVGEAKKRAGRLETGAEDGSEHWRI